MLKLERYKRGRDLRQTALSHIKPAAAPTAGIHEGYVEDEPEVMHVAFQTEIPCDELLNNVVRGVLKGAVPGLGRPEAPGLATLGRETSVRRLLGAAFRPVGVEIKLLKLITDLQLN